MEREQLKGKQTPGNISLYRKKEWDEKNGGAISMNAQSWSELACIYQHCVSIKYAAQGEANAALYAEAHNVANDTGMWPLDMVERIKELEEALRELIEIVDENIDNETEDEQDEYSDAMNKYRAILNKRT